jgi:hypothetical protein
MKIHDHPTLTQQGRDREQIPVLTPPLRLVPEKGQETWGQRNPLVMVTGRSPVGTESWRVEQGSRGRAWKIYVATCPSSAFWLGLHLFVGGKIQTILQDVLPLRNGQTHS